MITAKNKRFLTVLTLFLSSYLKGWAFTGTSGANFLDIPIGGRPTAMGSAYSALANDVYAPIYNPSGLGFLSSSQLATTHLTYLEPFSYEFIGFAHPFSSGRAIGAAVQYVHSGNTASTDINGNTIGDFSSSHFAYSLGYGQTVSQTLSLGAVAKLIHESIAGESAQAVFGDVGLLYKPWEKLNLSAVVANFGKKTTFQNTGDATPLSYRLGGAVGFLPRWMLTLQGTFPKNGKNRFQTGLEWNPVDILALRAGYDTSRTKEMADEAGFTTGVGLFIAGQEFDYAWVPLGDLGDTHYFSLVFSWGANKLEKHEKV